MQELGRVHHLPQAGEGVRDLLLLGLHIHSRWDFHWQNSYRLAQPKEIKSGERMAVECHWDNSLPGAQDVTWGEGTSDEMCLGTFYMTQ